MSEFEKCLKENRLVRMEPSKDIILKEMENARFDLQRAKNSYKEDDCKWAMVQAYYAMFHAAKAMVLQKGYREKSHQCLIAALSELYVKTGDLDAEAVEDFELGMNLRHQADYGLVYDKDAADACIEKATEFVSIAESIVDC
jgi:uncharacterized protein (UPF0332 family)